MNADEHGFAAAQGDAKTRRSKATLLAILILAAIVAVQLWPGSFALYGRLGAATLWLVSVTSVAVLSYRAEGRPSGDEPTREILIWTIVGAIAAVALGRAIALTWEFAALDWLEVVAGTLFISLLYGSRRSRAYYPVALVGQAAGFVIAFLIIVAEQVRDASRDDQPVVTFVFWTTVMTVLAIAMSYVTVDLFGKRTSLPRADSAPGTFGVLWSYVHRLAAILTIVGVIAFLAPASRQSIKQQHASCSIPRITTPPPYSLFPDLTWPP